MKRIYIDESKWGAGYLRHPKTGRMCCLGFASLQCGAPVSAIRNVGMPWEVDTTLVNSAEFDEFAYAADMTASAQLIKAVNELRAAIWGLEPVNVSVSVGRVLADLNDHFRSLRPAQRKKHLKAVLKVLRMGFKEMGYRLVYRASK